jgi:hypothetical protein
LTFSFFFFWQKNVIFKNSNFDKLNFSYVRNASFSYVRQMLRNFTVLFFSNDVIVVFFSNSSYHFLPHLFLIIKFYQKKYYVNWWMIIIIILYNEIRSRCKMTASALVGRVIPLKCHNPPKQAKRPHFTSTLQK